MPHPPTFTATIDLSLKEKLIADLTAQGFSFSHPPYTIFSARKNKIVCILYESGSLVVQGKEKEEFIEFYLEPEILKNFHYTHREALLDLTPHIGVDEAGKGDFFGPLCIAGLYADEEGIKNLLTLGVRDSKRISDSVILKISARLKGYPHSIVRLFPPKYNELYHRFKNLNFLLAWGHATVLKELADKTSCKKAIIDQFADKRVLESMLEKKEVSLEVEQRTKAESDLVVAGASILARASFLEGMDQLSQKIGLSLPKGASALVLQTGKNLVSKWGVQILDEVSKSHFKTREQILQNHDTNA
jgi:ribonuclease HIII